MKFKRNTTKMGALPLIAMLFFCINMNAQVKVKELKNFDMTKYVFSDSAGHAASIKDLKGKYVLLDVWASWCRPCISRFPEFDALKSAFKDKHIVFLQLSCDSQERRWRNEMGFTGRHGDQWFINGNHDFMVELDVATIPRYMLIDKKGRLIDPRVEWKDNEQMSALLSKLKGI